VPEVHNYLGVEMPDGRVRIEGPFSAEDSKKRAGEIIVGEKLKVSGTLASSLGRAALILVEFIVLRQRIPPGNR